MPPKRTTTPMTDVAFKALIAQGVATALAEYEANRGSGNGDDSHDSGSGRRTERATLVRENGICFPYKQLQPGTRAKYQVLPCTSSLEMPNGWKLSLKTVGRDAAYGMS
ncbi:hypothetical protein Tco_0909550 [Tanacetum coccineum]|uniref:Uncharacterized protein n=1 Tax=Tanacetum coccineum TaxID=301880 RepID=A0ABQ5CRK0_9ASTR